MDLEERADVCLLPSTPKHKHTANGSWRLCPEAREASLLGPYAWNRSTRWQKPLREWGWDHKMFRQSPRHRGLKQE